MTARCCFPVLVALAACSQRSASPSPAPAKQPAKLAHVESNIARADYIGPAACGDCHAAQHALWSASLHRVMNANARDAGAVIGDFSGKVVRYRAGEAHFDRDLAGYLMTLRERGREVRYRVTRTIGKRGLQEYVGIAEGRTDEVRLPFGWWPRAGGWFPQPAFDPWLDEESFDPFAEVKEPWAERCPWCHSTYPMAQRIARSSGRAVGHGMEQYFEAARGTDRLAVDEQVTTGISCESCHLGGRAHADGAAISFVPLGAAARPDAPALPTKVAEQRRDPTVVNTICAQCHSGPSPRLADQTALRNSSEAIDLEASPCRGIKCTDCHDPHVADSHGETTRALAACVKCHDAFADPAAARIHGGHDGATCLDCHMPRIVMGIDHYVRTHRISSPTNATLISGGAPNACNLCHLDRTIDWTLTELRAGWSVSPRVSLDAYDHERSVGEVWLDSKSPAFRLIAAHAYASSPLGKFELPAIKRGLDDQLAYVRAWTRLAVEAIMDRR